MMEHIVHIWQQGGILIFGLAFLGGVIYVQLFHLLYCLRVYLLQLKTPEKVVAEQMQLLLSSSACPQRDVLRSHFHEMNLSYLAWVDRRITFLWVLLAVAPLLGILGTVSGMIGAFTGLGAHGDTVFSAGISKALITTQGGLVIAIPGIAILMLIRQWRNRLQGLLERLEAVCIQHSCRHDA